MKVGGKERSGDRYESLSLDECEETVSKRKEESRDL